MNVDTKSDGLGDPVRDLDKFSQIGHSSEAGPNACSALQKTNSADVHPADAVADSHDMLTLID